MLPVEVAKALGSGSSSIYAGAYLSELLATKQIMLSIMKVGGSHLYYAPGQEYRLMEFSKHLHEKDRRTFDLLKQEKVLRDADQTPLVRVSLREIKDFAKPLLVTNEGKQEIFWKWYLLSNGDAERMIASHLTKQKVAEVPSNPPPVPSALPQIPSAETTSGASQPVSPSVAILPVTRQAQVSPSIPPPEKAENKAAPSSRLHNKQQILKQVSNNPSLPSAAEFASDTQDSFAQELAAFCKQKQIILLSQEVIKKNSEVDLLLTLPSAIGPLTCYAKAKKKEKVNEADLTSAFVQAQLKKLPCLFMVTGKLTKKAEQLLAQAFLHQVTVVNLSWESS